ncbi:uncharacterized protein MYCFIDRAFT_83614 [Pseudocercospora fijiensis CIRAD86]|uniref:Nucleoside 2-deoxyribosyltransferase n=1 Tax=Pseudocercospora fijiensis (strain CIRAD86) TaxID=383855 RepID=M2Z9N7_PSEFD|nr:uncharacterized protein MYCFIDRAFT_83614 [Pseudocercospora fijiensis CIRAD86]EME86575.1 hypothetical protein MYCFIDRAFT_83614 [Pseudocercospora fijiensis CIRAD86]
MATSNIASSQPLDTHIDHPTTTNGFPSQEKTYTYYHAGPLFTLGDLHANVLLSRAITKLSNGKFVPLLPQDLEQRGDVTPHKIRDKDIRALLSCDLALFTYDGAELDSGTVVEYMIAKFADIPSVILRSDFRGGGDQGSHPSGEAEPWNLMSSFWPRTKGVVIDGMLEYKKALASAANAKQAQHSNGGDDFDVSKAAGGNMVEITARRCVDAMEEVLKIPTRMPKELRGSVYQWLALMPGYAEREDDKDMEVMKNLLEKKEGKRVLN